MNEIKSILLTAIITLISGEILYYITPKNKINDYIYALLYTVMVLSVLLSYNFSDFGLEFEDTSPYSEEVDEIINQIYLLEGEKELENRVIEALSIINIECVGIDAIIKINDSDEIMIEKVEVRLKYRSDIDRAEILLNELFEGLIPLEIFGEY